MSEPKVEIEYIVRRKDSAMTYSIVYSPEQALAKLKEAGGKATHKVIRKTTTYQEVFSEEG